MKFQKLSWVCLSLALLACPKPAPVGDCGGYACAEGQRCEGSTLTCVTDEPPVITLVKPSAVVNTATFALTGKITDDLAVTSAEWRTGVLPWQSITLAADGTFSITVEAPLADSESMVVNVRASDARVQVTADAQVKVDRVGPTLRLTAPGAAAVVNSATLDVTVEPLDGSGSLADFTIAGTAVPTPRSGVAATVTVQVPTALDREVFSVEATAADPYGNRTTQTFSILVDRVAPTVSFFAPAANASVSTASFSVDVQVMDRSPIQSAVFHFGGATVMGIDAGGGHWTADLFTALEEQDEVITVDVTDTAGNMTSAQRTVHVDRVGPTLTVTAPTAASLFRTNIAVAATTSAQAVSVTATLESQTVMLTGGPTSWTGTLTVPQRDSSAATVHVTATDASGNTTSADVSISVDTVAPVITFTAPTANQKFNAASFAAGPNVTVTWTVTDGDPQAATTTVNGAASTALTTAVPTSASDNPANYTSTVIAADRAGNTATASVSYSVDRVVPTVVTWTPANGARMVDPQQSVITFSEPVFGATPTTPGLTFLGNALQPGGVWDLNQTRYLLQLAFYKGFAVDVALTAGLADSHGNPVAAQATHRMHLATAIPSGTLIASNVGKFAATADADGVLRVSYLTTTGELHLAGDHLPGLFDIVPFTARGTKVSGNSWSTVDPVTLNAPIRWGSSVFDAAAAAGSQYFHFYEALGTYRFPSTDIGAVVSAPPLNHEPATSLTALVSGVTYTRGAFTRTFTTVADMITAQSADSWVVASYSGTQVRWSRYRCNRDTQVFPGPATYTCGGTEYGGSFSPMVPDLVEAAMTRSGQCLVVSVRQGASNVGTFFQRLDNCDGALGVNPPASCNPNTTLPGSSGYIGQKIAPYSANGEDTILFAFPAGTGNPSEYRLEKMLPGVCAYSTTFSTLFSVPNVRDYQPVQIGTKPAFIYVNTSNELRVFVP